MSIASPDASGPDLAAWLLEQIAEDERHARAVSRAPLLNTVVGRLTESARRYVEGGIVASPRPTPFFPFPTSLAELKPPAPPKRAVLDIGDGLFEVQASPFVTTDRVLAEAVAAEFDRVDPLPERCAYPSIGTERRHEP